jgi:hypothetical protein
MTVVLLILFAVGSFMTPEIFTSVFFIILYVLYALTLLVFAFFIPGLSKKVPYLLIACLIVGVIVEKSVNTRSGITMGKGGTYFFDTGRDTLDLELLAFTITRGTSPSQPQVEYESRILFNKKDTFCIRVNHPLRLEKARIYQSNYKNISPFMICYQDTLRIFEGQTAEMSGTPLTFVSYDPVLRRAAVRYNEVLFYLPVGRTHTFLNNPITIIPQSPELATVLEYVETRGHTALLLIALLSIVSLIFSMVKRK